MKKLALMILAATGLASPAFAQLRLTITSGVTDPIPIAVVPFARAVPADGGLDVANVVHGISRAAAASRACRAPT
jgi:Tol biopolymer transport system component